MAAELGAYYITVMPSLMGAKKQIESQLSGVDTSKVGSGLGKQLSSGMASGLSFDAVSAKFRDLGGKFESAGGKLTNAITKPFLIGAGVAAGVATLIGKSALDSYATWEQVTGGVETLFKGSADTVKGYADAAYRTAGISANDYMSQVTSFSASLIQSLGGDTAKAAEMGNLAIIDMSDNANKMGSSITDIQNAYQGFAKQNYTMLDNLKLGYGGTQEEMKRLIEDANKVKAANGEMADLSIESFADVVEAIHTVQTEMGITGTTALEAAETIEGSVASMKAAWTNWLTELGKDDADIPGMTKVLADSVVTAVKNVAPRVKQIFESLVASIPEIWGALRSELPPVFDPLLDKVETVITWFSGLKDSTKQMLGGFAGAAIVMGPFLTIIGKIMGPIGSLISFLPKIGGVLAGLTGPVGIAVAAVAALVAGFVYAWNNIDGFKEFFVGMWDGIKAVTASVVDWFTGTALPALVAAWDWLVEVTKPVQQVFADVWQGIQDAVKVVIDWFTTSFLPAFTSLWDTVKEAVVLAWDIIGPKVSGAVDFIKGAIETFMGWISAVWPPIWETIKGVITTVWDVISTYVTTAIGVIQGIIQTVMAVIKGDWSGAWEAIKGVISTIWEGIKSIVSTVFGGIKDTISNILETIKAAWGAAWDIVKRKLSDVWDGIKRAVKDSVENVLGTVRGIKDSVLGFFSGAGSWLFDSGKAIIQGLVNGIGNMVSAVKEAVGNVLSAARNLLPFSPAKEGPFSGRGWTLYSGESIVEALAQGVSQKANLFSGAVADTMAAGQSVIGRLGSPGLSGRASLASPLGAGYGGAGVTYYDNRRIYNPVAEPDSITVGRNLQKAASNVGGLV